VDPPVIGHLDDGYTTIDVETGYAPPVGVYTLVVEATDVAGNTATTDAIHFVVYDPAGGFATGGGWFWSGKGNLKRDLESEGKATFGFVVKYKQEAAAGNLEFQYHAGDINLKSGDIAWLAVSGTSAQFQGSGTINGEGLYTFRALAKDGDQGAGTSDEFNIRIWEGTDTEAGPIYNALHAELGGGNIMVHKK
jgi:hypothetical protein